MTHQEKIDYFISDMRQRGIGGWTAVPPAYRLAMLLGIKIRPPFFQSFAAVAIMTSCGWAICFGLIMHFFLRAVLPLIVEITGFAMTGMAFGLIMAVYNTWRAKKLTLPPWDEYPGAGQ